MSLKPVRVSTQRRPCLSAIAFCRSVVTSVLTNYYQLVTDREDYQAKHSALTLAQQLDNDNRRQVELGTLAPIEITTAEAQVATAEQDLTVSETNLLQQEVAIKNLLSRNGLADPQLATVRGGEWFAALERIQRSEQSRDELMVISIVDLGAVEDQGRNPARVDIQQDAAIGGNSAHAGLHFRDGRQTI